ncbi:MobC family plasmid mobilization relaxosome protein [Nocardia sp. NPDC023852]|uniref:MobC family plasmid mobilization relaxosome protein n=1 Tax=Nocardia sp. NPDC023852 TaxID=3154697 RepID=UPI0033F1BC43
MVTQVPERPDSAAATSPTTGEGVASKRRMQDVTRARSRKRRENIGASVKRFRVTVSEAEAAALAEAAAEASMTVPRYLAESALNPTGGRVAGEADEAGPWLPWPKRKTLAGILLSAAGAMDEVRVEHLAKIGGNLNQIAHAAHVTGTLAEDIDDTLAQLRVVLEDLAARAARLDELAREVTRR